MSPNAFHTTSTDRGPPSSTKPRLSGNSHGHSKNTAKRRCLLKFKNRSGNPDKSQPNNVVLFSILARMLHEHVRFTEKH